MKTLTKDKIGTVCPKCGVVYKNGKKFAQAWGLDSWIRQGYVREVCPECSADKILLN